MAQKGIKDFSKVEDFIKFQRRILKFANGVVVYHYICDDENIIFIPKSKSSAIKVSFPMTARSEVIDYIRNNLPVEGEVVSEKYECELYFVEQHCLIVNCTRIDDSHTNIIVFFADHFLFKGKVDIPISDMEALHTKAREHGASFLVRCMRFNELQTTKSLYKAIEDKSCKGRNIFLKGLMVIKFHTWLWKCSKDRDKLAKLN